MWSLHHIGGLEPPTKEQIEAWGFNDINTALVNTVTTLVSSTPSITKEDVISIMEESNKTMREENKKIREEMELATEQKMKEDRLTNDAKHEELQNKMDFIQDTLMLALNTLQEMKGARPTLKNVE